jgi:hypothetical protein
MTRLWEEEMTAHSHMLRLETFNSFGGAADIVRTHLASTMSALSPAEHEIASRIFRFLVTPSGSKIALTVTDLANYTDLPESELTPILQRLSNEVRILRSINPPAGLNTATRYEIFHDVLATAILDWQTRSAYERQLISVNRSWKQLIWPCLLAAIVDSFVCIAPVGTLLVWLLLRRKNLGLHKDLVNAITVGWVIGWGIGVLMYISIYLAGVVLSVIVSPPQKDFLLKVTFISTMVARLLISPLCSLIAVIRLRRQAQSRIMIMLTTAPARA